MLRAVISRDDFCESPLDWDHIGELAIVGRSGRISGVESPDEPVWKLYFYNGSYEASVSTWIPESWALDAWAGYFWFDEAHLAKEELTADLAFSYLEGLVEVYSQWRQGHCWHVEVWIQSQCEHCGHELDKDNEDSCGGFIGEVLEDTGILDNFGKEYEKVLKEAWEHRFEHSI